MHNEYKYINPRFLCFTGKGVTMHVRLFHAVEGHAKATGEWQWLVSSPSFTSYPKSLAEVFPSFSLVQGKYEFGLKLIGNMF
jgi:hypothetical protein